MATLILSSGDRVNVFEGYQDVKKTISITRDDFAEFKMMVRITPADPAKNDYTIEEPVLINWKRIEQIF